MSLDYPSQFSSLCDKQDAFSAYFDNDFFLKDQPADFLPPTAHGEDFVDVLFNQLKASNTTADVPTNENAEEIDDRNCLFGQEDIFKLLDELDVDETLSGIERDEPNSSVVFSAADESEECTNDPNILYDEHDYAVCPPFPLRSSSDERSSESPVTSYERRLTSNSSSSSTSLEFPAVSAEECVVSDAEYLPVSRRRCANTATKRKSQCDPVQAIKRKYPVLILTEEERQLCEKEQIYLPSHYPLTKDEERKLRAIQRKIRNKVSAQQSRKKKQEYIEALEHRATVYSEENRRLKNQVQSLSNKNGQLQAQVRKLQDALTRNGRRSVQTGTCLAVLMISLALLVAPEYGPFGKERTDSVNEMAPAKAAITPGNTRTILQLQDPTIGAEDDNYSLPTLFSGHDNEFFDSGWNMAGQKKRNRVLFPEDRNEIYRKRIKISDPYQEGTFQSPSIPVPGQVTTVDLGLYKPTTVRPNASVQTSYQLHTVKTDEM